MKRIVSGLALTAAYLGCLGCGGEPNPDKDRTPSLTTQSAPVNSSTEGPVHPAHAASVEAESNSAMQCRALLAKMLTTAIPWSDEPTEAVDSTTQMAMDLINPPPPSDEPFKIALKADEDEREPLFVSEKSPKGLLVTCNEIGNRYRYELVGTAIAQGKVAYTDWIVNGRSLKVDVGALEQEAPVDLELEIRHLCAKSDDECPLQLLPASIKVETSPRAGKTVFVGAITKKEVMQSHNSKENAVTKVMSCWSIIDKHVFVAFVFLKGNEDESAFARCLAEWAASLERLRDLPTNRAALTVEYLQKHGLTLKQSFYLRKTQTGQESGALVNANAANTQDRSLAHVRLLEPKELCRSTLFHLLTRQGDFDLASDDELGLDRGKDYHRGLRMEETLMNHVRFAIVSDKALTHAIRLIHFDRRLGGYVYWDPWPAGKGSFLSERNNIAGVAAKRHPAAEKFYWVTEAELVRVLYAVDDDWAGLEEDRKLMKIFSGEDGAALAALRELHANDPNHSQTTEARLLGAGQFYLIGKETRTAATAFRCCQGFYPTSIDAIIGLADARRLQGNLVAATGLYEEALSRLGVATGSDYSDRSIVAKRARLVKHIREGLGVVVSSAASNSGTEPIKPTPSERRTESSTTDREFYNALVNTFPGMGQLDALILLKEIEIGRVQENQRSYDERGVLYRVQGDSRQAVSDHTRAIAIAPKKPWSYLLRGLALAAQRDYQGGIADLTKAVDLDSEVAEAYLYRGICYAEKHDHGTAKPDFDKAISLNPGSGRSYSLRGLAREIAGDLEGAVADQTKAIECEPKVATYRINRANLHRIRKEYKQAIADLDRAIELKSGNPVAVGPKNGINGLTAKDMHAFDVHSLASTLGCDDVSEILRDQAFLCHRIGNKDRPFSDDPGWNSATLAVFGAPEGQLGVPPPFKFPPASQGFKIAPLEKGTVRPAR
jgi:tetratricopeptide (TPR) repeat protein